MGEPDWKGLNHWQGIVWDPGSMGIPRLRLCYDCLCLISLFRDVLLFVCDQADSSTLVLTDIGAWRTIVWELGSLGRVLPSCFIWHRCVADQRPGDGYWARRADDILSLQGVGVRWVSLLLWKMRSW